MMQKEKIPVVFGLDQKYVLPAFVVMHSILQNSDERYCFYMITADDILKQVEKYSQLLEKEYDNFEVYIKKIAREKFQNAKIYNRHLSTAAYFRLAAPELIVEHEKCIYLDCDIIVKGNLAEFFQIDIEEDYIAGVRDCHVIKDTPQGREHEKILGLPSKDKYINSGVLLMNLRKMREDGLEEKFFIQVGRENRYEDQDVLNACCYPKIRILPLKYNLFHFYYGKSLKLLYELDYSNHDFDFKEPLIVHMGAFWKPWKFRNVKCADEWWCLADIFKDTEWYMKYAESSQSKDELFFERVQENMDKQIVVCGYTDNGKSLCDLLYAKGYSNIVAIMDNCDEKKGQVYKGIPVMGMKQIVKKFSDVFWIISNQTEAVYEEIRKQILGYGWDDKSVERYVNYHNNKFYLLALDPKYYDLEIDRMALLEYTEKYKDYHERKSYILQILNAPISFCEEYNYLNNKYYLDDWYHI